jgi:hypothetical protein
MMSWHTLTHGWHGLALGWCLVAVPLWIGMAQGHAPFWKWVRSPVTAVILLVIAGILIEVGQGMLNIDSETSTLAQMVAMTCYVLTQGTPAVVLPLARRPPRRISADPSSKMGGGTSRFASRLIGEREIVRRQLSEGHSSGSLLAGERSRTSTNIPSTTSRRRR